MRWLCIAFVLFAGSAQAAQVIIDQRAGEVTFRGQMNWEHTIRGQFSDLNPNPGEEFLPRRITDYEITLPVAGTPFGPDFVRPGPLSDFPYAGPARASIGNPQLLSGGDRFETDGFVVNTEGADPARLPPNTGTYFIYTRDFFFTFPVDGGVFPDREGDRRWNFAIQFDSTFQQVVAISATQSIRTPIPGNNETFSLDVYEGVDRADLPVDVQVVPLPGAVVLMATGLVALAGYKRLRRRG